jgi:hypothetical protein
VSLYMHAVSEGRSCPLMWTHLFEVSLTGVALFAIPLTLIAALASGLALFDRIIPKGQPDVSRDGRTEAEAPDPGGARGKFL